MPTPDQGLKGRDGQIRRAEKSDAKRIRRGQGELLRFFRSELLFALLDIEAALESTDSIDEEKAIEVVVFVLDDATREACELFFLLRAVESLEADLTPVGSSNLCVDARE
jgi:hypothetical protein